MMFVEIGIMICILGLFGMLQLCFFMLFYSIYGDVINIGWKVCGCGFVFFIWIITNLALLEAFFLNDGVFGLI